MRNAELQSLSQKRREKKHDQSTECEWRWREVTCSADVQVPTLHYSHKSCEKYKQWSPGVYRGCPGVFNKIRTWSIWVILGIWWKGLPQHHWCSHTDQKIHDVSRTGQYHDMRLDIILEFGCHSILIWHKYCLSLVLKVHYSKMINCSSIFLFAHWVIISTLLMSIYQKYKISNILWKHQQSPLQYCHNIDIGGIWSKILWYLILSISSSLKCAYILR